MSNGLIKYRILFSLLMFTSSNYSQENIIPNVYQKNNTYTPPIFTRTIQNLNGINLSSKNITGDWKIFKNWNEGRAVVAESDSIVWVGTPVGLVRWNVVLRTYKTFDEDEGLYFTAINSLSFDKTGRLWIAATQGLAVLTDGVFRHYDNTNSPLPKSSMEVVCVDNSNRVVVAIGPPLDGGYNIDGGVARFDGNTWNIWLYGSSIYSGPTTDMEVYNDTVWITGGEDLFILTENSLERAPGWNYAGATSIAVDYQDSLWAESTMRKTVKYTKNGWQVIIDRDLEGMGGLYYDIWNDPRGGLWLSMKDIWWCGYGPYRLDFEKRKQGIYCGTNFAGFCTVQEIPGQFYAHDAVSASAQFFVSIGIGTTWPQQQTEQGGLFKYNGVGWEIFRIPPTILENKISSLGAGRRGDMYLSTPFYTQKTNGQNWEMISGVQNWNKEFQITPNDSLFTNANNLYGYIQGLDFDGYGNLWTVHPLKMYRWPNLYPYNYNNIVSEITQPYQPQFMDVIVDKYEHVWAAAWSYGGIMYDRINWHPYPPSDSTLPNGDYDVIFADTKGNVWFGTNQSSPNYGFTVFDGKAWQTYYSPQRYFISYVYQIAEDHFGNIWLATRGGLLKYDGYSFTVYDRFNSPLSLNYTSAVTVDERGNIWIGTDNGLYVYNPNSMVELGNYSFTSPVDSLRVIPEEHSAIIAFHPNSPSSTPVTYQLQRGRGTHKFWTIAEVEYSSSVPPVIEIIDSSLVIGQYFYRINEVTPDGKIRFSQSVIFNGGVPGVSLINFEHYLSENLIFFKWETSNESFIKRYELWRSDSVGGQFSTIKLIEPDTTNNEIKHYEIQGDIFEKNAVTKQYSLRVVYLDSSRSELSIIEVGPEKSTLPITFLVSHNYPNPFNSSTNFDVSMPDKGLVTLKFYDVLGEEVLTVGQYVNEGYYSINVNFSVMTSGVYFYSISSFDKKYTGKLVLLK